MISRETVGGGGVSLELTAVNDVKSKSDRRDPSVQKVNCGFIKAHLWNEARVEICQEGFWSSQQGTRLKTN